MEHKAKGKDAPVDTCPACGRKKGDAYTRATGTAEVTSCPCGYVWESKAIEES